MAPADVDPKASDALVLFGVTGDLVHKNIFPALYAMAVRGALTVPVIGVASSSWSIAQLRARAEDGIRQSGRVDHPEALHHLLSLLRYVCGRLKLIDLEIQSIGIALSDGLISSSKAREMCEEFAPGCLHAVALDLILTERGE